jgi:hypothetical protein
MSRRTLKTLKNKREPSKDGFDNKYKCRYCKHEFKQYVRKINPASTMGKPGKHGGGSSQVPCPKCKMCLRTWEDAI